MRIMQAIVVLTILSAPIGAEPAKPPPNQMPPLAQKYVPNVLNQIDEFWSILRPRSSIGAQIEKESCVSLSSKRCWSPDSELRVKATSTADVAALAKPGPTAGQAYIASQGLREYGFGLGQTTITSKMNVFEELKRQDIVLRGWRWEDRFNVDYQIRAILVLNKRNYDSIRFADDEFERMAFTFSAYNGGLGGVLKDRKLCEAQPTCDAGKWFGNVSKYSFKSKVAIKGYGKSFFDINRGYVDEVLLPTGRRVRYMSMDKESRK